MPVLIGNLGYVILDGLGFSRSFTVAVRRSTNNYRAGLTAKFSTSDESQLIQENVVTKECQYPLGSGPIKHEFCSEHLSVTSSATSAQSYLHTNRRDIRRRASFRGDSI